LDSSVESGLIFQAFIQTFKRAVLLAAPPVLFSSKPSPGQKNPPKLLPRQNFNYFQGGTQIRTGGKEFAIVIEQG
jgi:hypothetical protein